MKRMLTWLIGIVGVVGFLSSAEAAKEQKEQGAKQSEAAPTAQAGNEQATKEETIVYTFPDQAKVDEFTKLWQQRQGVVLRVTVLQAYLSQEQAAFTELNNKLLSDYKLDPAKNYFLDSKRHVLLQYKAPPATPQSSSENP